MVTSQYSEVLRMSALCFTPKQNSILIGEGGKMESVLFPKWNSALPLPLIRITFCGKMDKLEIDSSIMLCITSFFLRKPNSIKQMFKCTTYVAVTLTLKAQTHLLVTSLSPLFSCSVNKALTLPQSLFKYKHSESQHQASHI